MTWACVLCGHQAVAEVQAGVPVAMCAGHQAAFERRWCSVTDCTVPTHGDFCEAHGRLAVV